MCTQLLRAGLMFSVSVPSVHGDLLDHDTCPRSVSVLRAKNGDTALMWASSKGHTELVRMLVYAKADLKLKNRVIT